MKYKIIMKVITGKNAGLIVSSTSQFEPTIGEIINLKNQTLEVINFKTLN